MCLETFAKKALPDGNYAKYKTKRFTYEAVIPSPKTKKECPKEYLMNEESHSQALEDRPWFDWYRFHLNHWGTKWNACDGYTKIGATQLTFVFSTAWSIPDRIYEKLFTWCDEQGYDIEVRYADEDIGSNCGMISLKASEHDLTHCHEAEITNPDRFAKYIWDNY